MNDETPASAKVPASVDMVCRRAITGDPSYFPQAEYQGRTVYFCTEYCLSAFLSDPERFQSAHSRKRGDPQGCGYNPEEKPRHG